MQKRANEKRLIDANVVYEKGHRTPFHIGIADLCDLKELLADVPTVDAVEVVYCDECKSHGSCIPEDTFRWMRIEKPYCCVGKRKTNTNFDAKMGGDGNA